MPLNVAPVEVVPRPAIEAKPKPPRVLSSADRCDACNYATAFVRVFFASGDKLDFCKHHWETYRDAIGNKAVDVINETEYLNERLDVSA